MGDRKYSIGIMEKESDDGVFYDADGNMVE